MTNFQKEMTKTFSTIRIGIQKLSININATLTAYVERSKIKESIKELEKRNLASSSSMKNYGKSRKRIYKSNFTRCLDKIYGDCKILSSLPEEKYSSRIDDYDEMIGRCIHKFKAFSKDFYQTEIKKYKKFNISKESLEELKLEIDSFSNNINEFSSMGIDYIDKIEKLSKKSENPQLIQFYTRVCSKISLITQRLITDYATYPSHLIKTFQLNSNIKIDKKGN